MGYRRMNINDLKDIYRRFRSNQSIRLVSESIGYDRKTIRLYRDAMQMAGVLSGPEPVKETALEEILIEILPTNDRNSPVQDAFRKHLDEIIKLTTRKEDPIKLKTAFLVIKQKYDLPGSYESFKVFSRKDHLSAPRKKAFPRIECPVGQETQIDYCKCGLHTDTETGKRRVVNGFIAKLSASRLPFVEFTYSQSQESFVESNIRMVEFFGGVTEYLTIDNLKAGVIKAHIYEPQLNKAYAEFAEHYGTFINPCIPGHAKGKAKVERQVQETRELFRRLKELHPSFSLRELNVEAKKWCTEEYGMTVHGTTSLRPFEAFKEDEEVTLTPLNPVRFEIPVWKSAKVHMDQFVSCEKKRFSMPLSYRQKTVHCRRSGSLMKIYDENYLFIRQYVISSRKIHCTDGDFPPGFEAMMLGTYPQYLIRKAAEYGRSAKSLIRTVLKPHAFINARNAKGMIDLLDKYKDLPLLQEVCKKAVEKNIRTPGRLKIMLDDEQNQQLFEFVVSRSDSGEAMIRDIEEYIN